MLSDQVSMGSLSYSNFVKDKAERVSNQGGFLLEVEPSRSHTAIPGAWSCHSWYFMNPCLFVTSLGDT